jgi:hypothetical protein
MIRLSIASKFGARGHRPGGLVLDSGVGRAFAKPMRQKIKMDNNQHSARVSGDELTSARAELNGAGGQGHGHGRRLDAQERGARGFFWALLFSASVASVAGNVTHAVWNSSGAALVVAAVAAVVPPLSLWGACHSVGVLARVRTNSFTFWASMVIAIAVVACAFWLSFNALRSVARDLAGVDPGIAWMMPLCIDFSIAGSTLALLSLSRPSRGSVRPDASPAAATNGRRPASGPATMEAVPRSPWVAAGIRRAPNRRWWAVDRHFGLPRRSCAAASRRVHAARVAVFALGASRGPRPVAVSSRQVPERPPTDRMSLAAIPNHFVTVTK